MSPPANENRSTTGGDTPVTSPPTPDEWKQLEPLVDALLDAPIAQRDTLLSELSGGDHARRLELERLVAECERLYPLLDDPPAKRFAAVMEAESPLLPELLAGRYRVLREAGRGGMAIVYLARDLKHGRDVAIKVVPPSWPQRWAASASCTRSRLRRSCGIHTSCRCTTPAN